MAAANGSAAVEHPGGAEQLDRNDPGDGVYVEPILGSDGDGTPDSPRDPVVAAKRGRGRPRKDGGDGASPSHRSEKGSSGSEAVSKKPTKLDINVFSSQIVGAHKMLAMVTKNPLLEISDKEAESLAAALKNVMQYHNINISPSVLAYVQLIGVCLAVYGPRVALFAAASKAEKDAKKRASEFGAQHGTT